MKIRFNMTMNDSIEQELMNMTMNDSFEQEFMVTSRLLNY